MSDRDTPQPESWQQQVDATVNPETTPPEGDNPPAETVGTGSAIALGCVLVTVVLILLGVVFFVILWLVA